MPKAYWLIANSEKNIANDDDDDWSCAHGISD